MLAQCASNSPQIRTSAQILGRMIRTAIHTPLIDFRKQMTRLTIDYFRQLASGQASQLLAKKKRSTEAHKTMKLSYSRAASANFTKMESIALKYQPQSR